MTEEDKKAYHAFIKFLTDKEVYTLYTGRSALALRTVGEDSELMGLVYPYYLGYKYRNARAEGLDPVQLFRRYRKNVRWIRKIIRCKVCQKNLKMDLRKKSHMKICIGHIYVQGDLKDIDMML